MRAQLYIAVACLFTAPLAHGQAKSKKAAANKAPAEEPSKGPQLDPEVREEIESLKKELAEAKEKLTRNHERLTAVREAPTNQPAAGNAKVAIVYRNDMTSMFTPVKYDVAVDGYSVFSKADTLEQKEVEIYRGNLTEGPHQVLVTLTFRGNGGTFAYLKGYKFVGRAGHVFNVLDDKLTQVKIISGEKSASTPKDRPTIEFQDTNWNINVPSAGTSP